MGRMPSWLRLFKPQWTKSAAKFSRFFLMDICGRLSETEAPAAGGTVAGAGCFLYSGSGLVHSCEVKAERAE